MARYLGLEITPEQLKAVVLRTGYKKIVVEAIYRVQRAPGAEGLAQAVEAIAQAAGAVDATYAALPGTDAALRWMELPRAVYKRGLRVLTNELDGALPFDVSEATLDSLPLSQHAVVELIAVAAKTDKVRALIETLKGAGAEPREVGVAPLALGELASTFGAFATAEPVLVVHAYETFADVAVIEHGAVQLARTLGAQGNPAVRSRSLKQTLGAYLAGGGRAPIAAFILGEAAYFYPEVVAEATSLPAEAVYTGLPAGSIELNPSVNPAELALAPVALALALRGLGRGARADLRKGPLAVSGSAQIVRDRAGLFAGLAAALLVSWGFAMYARYTASVTERDRLRTALGQVTFDVFNERVTDAARAVSLARGQGPDAEQDPLPGADAYDVFGVLTARIPQGIHHDVSQLDVRDERVELQGLVDSLADRDRIVEALGQYECFRSVTPGRAQRNPGDSRQQYALDIELRCPTEREREAAAAARRAGTGASAAPSAGASARPSGAAGGSRGSN